MACNEVSTICGNGKPSFRDGHSTVARFDHPTGVAVDSEGSLFVLDNENNRVRKVSPNGVVSTLAGDGTPGFRDGEGTNARFKFQMPEKVNFMNMWSVGLAIDGDDNIIIADTGNHRIRKISRDGFVSTLAGTGKEQGKMHEGGASNGPGESASFCGPTGVAVDSEGNVVVSDTFNHCIRMITTEGHVSTIAGNPGIEGFADGRGVKAHFSFPCGVSVDWQGFIYVVDPGNACLRSISPEGDVIQVREDLFGLLDCAVDGNGNVVISESIKNQLSKVTHDGKISCLAGKDFLPGTKGLRNGPGDQASFHFPCGVAIDHDGNVIVCDSGTHSLRLIAAGLTPPGGFIKQAEDVEDGMSTSSLLASLIVNPQFSDVKVHVGQETFHAHAIILSRFPFFKAALNHESIERSHREVTLKDMTSDTFRCVLKYMYTEKLDFCSNVNMLQLHAAADFLGLSKLKRTCESKISKNVNTENVIQYFQHAAMYSSDALKRRCVRVASESVASLRRVVLTKDYAHFMHNDPTLHEGFVHACNAN